MYMILIAVLSVIIVIFITIFMAYKLHFNPLAKTKGNIYEENNIDVAIVSNGFK